MTFIRHKVNNRVVQDLKKRSTIGIIFYIVLSVIVTCADGFYFRQTHASLIFLFSNLGICSFRLVHLVIAQKMGEPHETINRGIFYVSVVITALVWGCMLAYVEILNNEHVTQLMMNVCICGLCAGGVVAFIPDRRLAILFNIAMLMPATAALIMNRLNPPLAIMICLFSIYLVLIAIRGNKEYWNALENEHLLEVKSEEMTRLSNTDVLTGLSNRRHFNEVLDREWKRSGRNQSLLSLIILDIDYFKKINDTYGHQVGDEYLKKIAETLVSVFKRDSDIVARYGGEEFAVLLVDSDVEQAIQLAEAAIHCVAAMSINHQGKKVSTTISAGVNCRIPDYNAVSDSLVLGADKALYAAKSGGRNRVVLFE